MVLEEGGRWGMEEKGGGGRGGGGGGDSWFSEGCKIFI